MQVTGFQLDLLTVIKRLEQIEELITDGEPSTELADQIWSRVMTCDVPRLRCYLTAETRAFERWSDHADHEPEPLALAAGLGAEDHARWERSVLQRVLDGLRRL